MSWPGRALALTVGILLIAWFAHYEHVPSEAGESRFIKLNKQGEPMHPWQGPWSCIFDTESGLVWENKTDDESIHDALWTFSWYQQGKGVKNSGDCYFEPDRCDTSDLIRRMNAEETCGLNEWRLPTVEELNSLVNDNPKTGDAKIAGDFFSYTKRGDYWTSDADVVLQGVYAHLKSGAIALDFIEGKPRAIPYRNAAFVRLVSVPPASYSVLSKKK